MATRFYPDPTNAPSVSPAYESTLISKWTDTTQAVRRKLVIDTPGNNASTSFQVSETSASPERVLAVQFVSEPLDANASVTLADMSYAFRCLESAAKADAVIHLFLRKCDGDGSNDEVISASSYISGGPEFDDGVLTNRYATYNRTDGSIAQGQRLIVEVGVLFQNTKDAEYLATINVTDNHATTDLGKNDTDTAAYNSWIETGDTFTEASGEPAAIKLGPIFTFA